MKQLYRYENVDGESFRQLLVRGYFRRFFSTVGDVEFDVPRKAIIHAVTTSDCRVTYTERDRDCVLLSVMYEER